MRAIFVAGICAFALTCTAANGANLGVANDYNGFILGSDTQFDTDTEGRLACGGAASLNNYAVTSALTGFAGPALVTAGTLNYTNGEVYWGDVYVGGTANLTSVIIANGQLFNPANPIDFVTASAYLDQQSAAWGALAPNGTTLVQFGGITLTGLDPSLNIFSVNGSDLSSANSLTISAPASSTILVNVNGTSNTMQNFGTTFAGGAAKQYTLYNFYQTSALGISGISVEGSVLAPGAGVTFDNGNTEGTLVAATLYGNGELHNYPFEGDLPSPVPDASTLTLALVSGMTLTAQALCRRRRGPAER